MKQVLHDKGFTLLEVVISLGLIAIALLSVFHLQASNLELQSEAKFITIASQLNRDRISFIRSDSSIIEGAFSGDFGEQFPEFRYTGEIREVMTEGLYRLHLDIMTGETGYPKTLTSEVYIYRAQK